MGLCDTVDLGSEQVPVEATYSCRQSLCSVLAYNTCINSEEENQIIFKTALLSHDFKTLSGGDSLIFCKHASTIWAVTCAIMPWKSVRQHVGSEIHVQVTTLDKLLTHTCLMLQIVTSQELVQ